MSRWIKGWMSLFGLLSLTAHAAQPQVKEWTFLIYLNGNNSLDTYGSLNINQMEAVGSSDKVNVVVQWASMSQTSVKRLYIQKDSDPNTVTSPVVQDMGPVDMGDWHSLADFIQWGAKTYPAKHYFVDVWDHGGGWHLKSFGGGVRAHDISWDDKSGHVIKTEELGLVMAQAAQAIGHKVEIFGTDACLMSMGEVVAEMTDSVEVFTGSQETEPDAGWPYEALLNRWNAMSDATPAAVGAALAEEYVKSYEGGSNGTQEVTFSALDLSKFTAFTDSIRDLGKEVSAFSASDKTSFETAVSQTQSYAYADYVDVIDLADNTQKSGLKVASKTLDNVRNAVQGLVISNHTTSTYTRSHGISLWAPDQYNYQDYIARYKGLKFHAETQWGDALTSLWGTN